MSDRLAVTVEQVTALVAAQFPHWAHLPVRPVALSGWDNHTFHLGDRMKMRLPSAERYVAQVDKENGLLPRLAPHLPLPIPHPVAVGRPGSGFPFPWSIYDWIEGDIVTPGAVTDLSGLAVSLGGFLKALQSADASVGPAPGDHNFHRGGDLGGYDAETRDCIERLGDRIDGALALAVWDNAMASRWTREPVWVHGDIAVGNLLLEQGQLSAVIDFGSSAVGDPACDLVIAWTFLDKSSRDAFRAALPLDADTWARARGWALWKALLVAANEGSVHPAERPPLEVLQLLLAEASGRR